MYSWNNKKDMRLVLHNPHTKVFFWQTVFDVLARNNITKKSQKYRYLLDYLAKNKIEFWIYIDYEDSSFPKIFKNRLLIKIEVFFRLLLKKVNPLHVKVISRIENITKDDIFFWFSIKNLDTEYHGIDTIAHKDFIKIFHFTHYVQNTSLVAKNLKRLNGDFIVAENNLSKKPYFNHFFKYYKKDVYTLPFTYAERYKRITPFNERQNKCLSTWSIVDTSNFPFFDDFESFYKVHFLQPLRKEILDNKDKKSEYIDCLMNTSKPESTLMGKILFICKVIFLWYKIKYYSTDIVQEYNKYKMFVNTEEHYDVPWIWFVEWIACGCAYIGKIDPMYTDLWMMPWVHYIWHDWSLNDIVEKIKYYQKNAKELEIIANNWYDFVAKNLNTEIVAKKFYQDLIKLHASLVEHDYDKTKLHFASSFIHCSQ